MHPNQQDDIKPNQKEVRPIVRYLKMEPQFQLLTNWRQQIDHKINSQFSQMQRINRRY